MKKAVTTSLLGVIAACGSAAPTHANPQTQGPPPLVTEYLVYDQAAESTRWVIIDDRAQLRDRASRPGHVVGGGDRVYEVERTSRVLASTCERGDETAHVESEIELADYALRDLVTNERIPISVGAIEGIDHYCAFERTCQPGHAIGTWYFTSCCVYVDLGGAHGSSECEGIVIDLRQGERVEPPLDVSERELDLGRRGIVEHVRSEGGGDDDWASAYALDTARATEIIPHYDALGHLALSARVTVDTCYACGFGDWSSSTASAIVPMAMHPGLARYDAIPRALAPFASRGVSLVDAPAQRRAVMMRAFAGDDAR